MPSVQLWFDSFNTVDLEKPASVSQRVLYIFCKDSRRLLQIQGGRVDLVLSSQTVDSVQSCRIALANSTRFDKMGYFVRHSIFEDMRFVVILESVSLVISETSNVGFGRACEHEVQKRKVVIAGLGKV